MDDVKATHKVIQSKETYAMFEDKYKFYHNFKNPSKYMPKTYKGSEFKSLKDVQSKVGKDFILKDRFNMGGVSLKRPGKEYEYSEAGIKKFLNREYVFQEKIPFKYEFRVHALDDLPYFIKEKHGKTPSAKTQDRILNFTQKAIRDMKKFRPDHHGMDVVVTNDGRMKIIENNAASGYGVFSTSAPRLTNLIKNKRLPFLGTEADRMRSQTLGLAAATGVGTTVGLEAKDAITKKSSLTKEADVVEKDGKFYVHSKTGKSLGGPYDTKEEANKRLGQIHYFKNRGKKAMWMKSFNEELLKLSGLEESLVAAEEAEQSAPEVQSGVQETFDITDVVEDNKPTCPHHGAIGVAVDVSPSDVTFVVRNESGKYKPGDVLTKTKDQLRVLAFGDNHDKTAELSKEAKDENFQFKDKKQSVGVGFGADGQKVISGNYGVGGVSNQDWGTVDGSIGGYGKLLVPDSGTPGLGIGGRAELGVSPNKLKGGRIFGGLNLGGNLTGEGFSPENSVDLGYSHDFKTSKGGKISPYIKGTAGQTSGPGGEIGVNFDF